MSDDEDFDEFPSITVNSSFHESSSFSMPSAEELATQRAREEACEQELLRLREEHDAHDKECADAMVAALAHSDSSGSEGEAALAAAVSALRVQARAASSASASAPARAAAALLDQLAPHLPDSGFIVSYLDAAREGSDPALAALTDEIASSIADMVVEAAGSHDVQVWAADEVVCIAAWLCAVSCAAGGGGRGSRRPVIRTLHLLIDDVATEQQVEAISGLLSTAEIQASAALELSDVLRSGSVRGDALARATAESALARLADTQERDMSGIAASLPGAWRRLPPARQYLALQLLSRLLPPQGGAGEGDGGARRLLDALAHAQPQQRAQTTDTLKVLVAARKLQVLFHVKK